MFCADVHYLFVAFSLFALAALFSFAVLCWSLSGTMFSLNFPVLPVHEKMDNLTFGCLATGVSCLEGSPFLSV